MEQYSRQKIEINKKSNFQPMKRRSNWKKVKIYYAVCYSLFYLRFPSMAYAFVAFHFSIEYTTEVSPELIVKTVRHIQKSLEILGQNSMLQPFLPTSSWFKYSYFIKLSYEVSHANLYPEHCQTSKMEHFEQIVNDFQQFTKTSTNLEAF